MDAGGRALDQRLRLHLREVAGQVRIGEEALRILLRLEHGKSTAEPLSRPEQRPNSGQRREEATLKGAAAAPVTTTRRVTSPLV